MPTATTRNPYSHKNAARVACEWKQPCSSLHHYTTSISSPKHIAGVFPSCPVHYKCSFSLPQSTCAQFPKQLARKYPPKAPICMFLHPVHANSAPLQWCSVLVRPRRFTQTSGWFSCLLVLHWGDTWILGTRTQSAQALRSFPNRTRSHWRRQGATTGARHCIGMLLHCAVSKSRCHLVPPPDTHWHTPSTRWHVTNTPK